MDLSAAAILLGVMSLGGALCWAAASPDRRGRLPVRVVGFLAHFLATPILVGLPLLAYVHSLSLEPHWPDAEAMGWASCLTTTGYVWLPVILWACASMYATAAIGMTSPAWVRAGLLMGCMAALFLTIAGWRLGSGGGWDRSLKVGVPAITFLSYAFAFAVASARAPLPRRGLIATAVVGLALAAANIGAAIARMGRIPYQTPVDCYVVTAATRGHARLVVPLHEERRGGVIIRVNRQLMTLRAFESVWRTEAPRSHALARGVYDRIGPLVASRLTNAWVADLAYISLKPLEWIAAGALRARS